MGFLEAISKARGARSLRRHEGEKEGGEREVLALRFAVILREHRKLPAANQLAVKSATGFSESVFHSGSWKSGVADAMMNQQFRRARSTSKLSKLFPYLGENVIINNKYFTREVTFGETFARIDSGIRRQIPLVTALCNPDSIISARKRVNRHDGFSLIQLQKLRNFLRKIP